MRILVVKTSSLGDIVHALPALTDAQAAIPSLRCDWVAERGFAEIPAWHPAVDRVIASNLRQWRRKFFRFRQDITWQDFKKDITERPYDLIIDAQGLIKSAMMARMARGPRAGLDRHSAREPLASWTYQHRYAVAPHTQAHAIERNRRLFAQALDYKLPSSAPNAGFQRENFMTPAAPGPFVMLLHGTTWPSKLWPTEHWIELGRWLSKRGLLPVLPWGTEEEHRQAQNIAGGCDGLVLPRLNISTLAGWLAHAQAFVGVDTGLTHLAAALGTPGVSLYGPTLPRLTGAIGPRQTLLSDPEADHVDRNRFNKVSVERAIDALKNKPELEVT